MFVVWNIVVVVSLLYIVYYYRLLRLVRFQKNIELKERNKIPNLPLVITVFWNISFFIFCFLLDSLVRKSSFLVFDFLIIISYGKKSVLIITPRQTFWQKVRPHKFTWIQTVCKKLFETKSSNFLWIESNSPANYRFWSREISLVGLEQFFYILYNI